MNSVHRFAAELFVLGVPVANGVVVGVSGQELLIAAEMAQSNLLVTVCRDKTFIYLEPNSDDKVHTLVDTIAQLIKQNPDDVAICFRGVRLDGKKTLRECDICLEGELPVEPIKLQFVLKPSGEDGGWEDPFVAEMSKPVPLPSALQADADGSDATKQEAPVSERT